MPQRAAPVLEVVLMLASISMGRVGNSSLKVRVALLLSLFEL
jgi:hypothetical protein